MSDFFKEQADYFSLIYGLTFVILGTVCVINKKAHDNACSLTLLGLFGFAYGLYEWVAILEISITNNYWLHILRLTLMLLSFAFLLEFGRIEIAQTGRPLPGRRIFISALLLAITVAILNYQSWLDDAIRFGFGFIGSFSASMVLVLQSRKVAKKSAGALFSAGLGMACFGLSISFIPPESSLFSTWFPTEARFLAVVGIPIQFFQAVFACWIAGAVLNYEIRKLEYPMPRQSVWLMNLGFAVLGLVLIFGFILTNYFDRLHQQTIRDHITVEVMTLAEYLTNEIPADEKNRHASAAMFEKNIQIEDPAINNIYAVFLVDAAGKILLAKGVSSLPENLWNLQRNGMPALFNHVLTNGEQITLDANTYIVGRKIINNENWSVVILEQEALSGTNRLFAIIMTLLVCSLTLVLLVILQKNILTELQLRHDHEELLQLSEALGKQSITDTLTGAFNRLKFDAELQTEMKAAIRYQTPLTLIMYDIDHFKRINDTYGHQVGDYVLKELTALVTNNIRASDILARWGGEEFMIIVPHDPNARALAEKLRYIIERHVFDNIDQLTCSFGVANLLPNDTQETFTGRVDSLLYEAKLNGRNRVEF